MTGNAPAVFLGYYPHKTLVTAKASGRIFWTQDWGTTGSYGPAGWMTGTGVINGQAFLSGTINNYFIFRFGTDVQPWAGQWVDTVATVVEVKDTIWADRSTSSISQGTKHYPWYCGTGYPGNPCIVFSGSTTISLQRIFADLILVADSMSVKAGSTVKFTNRIVDESVPGQGLRNYTEVLLYTWIPDDTSKGGSAVEAVDSSSSACARQTGDSTCTRVIQGSGRLRIRARVNGETMETEVRVNAIACPVGDPVLDHKEIRKALKQMWNASNPDSAPGSGRTSACRDANGNPVTCGHKKEQGVWIFRRPDSSFYAVPVTPQYHDECSIDFGAPPAAPEAGSILWAVAHSHPNKNGDRVYCNRKDQDGRPIDLYVNDPIGKSVGKKGKDISNGGGSDADWQMAQSSPNIDVYVMNKNDEIYRLPAYTPKGDEKKDVKKRRKYWRGDRAACPF